MRVAATILFLIVNFAVVGGLSAPHHGASSIAGLILTIILSFFVILAHELGHALAVHRLGGVVHTITVMIFRYDLQRRELTVSPPHRGDIGGYVAYTCVERWWTKRKEAIVAAAGPGANLALAIVMGALATVLHGPVQILAGALCLLSSGMGLANLIPFRGSDGDHLLHALSARYRRTRRR